MANIQSTDCAKSLAFASSRSRRPSRLLDGGATVPFVARYRKEITGGLDDAQLRTLEERLTYLARARGAPHRDPRIRSANRASSMPRWRRRSLPPTARRRLEDIYLPFKPKRRTKAEIAREAGPRAAGRAAADAAAERSASARPQLSSMPKSRCRTSRPRSRARAPSWSSASTRTPI